MLTMPGFGTTVDIELSETKPHFFTERSVLVNVTGEINLYSAQKVKAFLESQIQKGSDQIYIDMSDVQYIDSSGLGALVAAHARILKQRGFIKIIAPSDAVDHVLKLTKLQNLIDIHKSLDNVTA